MIARSFFSFLSGPPQFRDSSPHSSNTVVVMYYVLLFVCQKDWKGWRSPMAEKEAGPAGWRLVAGLPFSDLWMING
jgi:hypothetical protein